MKANELLSIIKQGERPIIKFNEGVYTWMEEAADPLMMAKIIDANIEDEDSVRFLLDLNDFETHNRSVASHDWRDENGECRLTWFDTIFYPKDGKEVIYLPVNKDVEEAFNLVNDTSLLFEYMQSPTSKETTYIEWLENEVHKLR